MSNFNKWYICWGARFPESILCAACNTSFLLTETHCPYCNEINHVSAIVKKQRPVILFQSQRNWYRSIAFVIPVSLTNPSQEDDFNQPIDLNHYQFVNSDCRYHQPMRAIISQATRITANAIKKSDIVGVITDQIVQQKIETKLLDWIFQE